MNSKTTGRAAKMYTLSLPLALLSMGCSDPITREWGTVVVTNTTTGGAFDPDGFEVRFDGDSVGFMNLNESVLLEVPLGPHSVTLGGRAENCVENGDPVREITVTTRSWLHIGFAVTCTAPPELASRRILFAEGEGLVSMNADGSGRTRLISEFGLADPNVSPDGAQIAFTGLAYFQLDVVGSYLWLANGEGSDRTLLVDGWTSDPRWSPDGDEIVYIASEGADVFLRVTSSDGSLALPLVWESFPDADGTLGGATWSPDGSQIAYTRVLGSGGNVFVVGRDGSSVPRYLVPGRDPLWSAEDRIAYVSYDGQLTDGVKTVNPDGTGAVTVLATDERSQIHLRDWSEDGAFLLYTDVSGTSGTDIYLLEVDSGATIRLTADGKSGAAAFWPGSAASAVARGAQPAPGR